MLNAQPVQLLALVIFIVAVKLFIDHKKKDHQGPYNPSGSYDKVTAVKHDMTKVFWTELFPIMVLGLATGEKFFDPNNFLGSKLGQILVLVAGYFIYYELFQPYVVNRMPVW